MIEVIIFAILTSSVAGYTIWDNRRMDEHAKRNQVFLRKAALREIDRSGLSVLDFPKYEDALRGERHLKVREIIDIYQTCRGARHGGHRL